MGLRVAFDLDGTVADLSRAMHAIAKRKFRKLQEAPAGDPPSDPAVAAEPPRLSDLDLSSSDLERLWTHVLKIRNFWTTLDEMQDGVVARIQQLADERRWDVLFVTTRPMAAGATTQVQSQEWLVSKGFRHPSVVVVKGSRGQVATALELDAVVDDRPDNSMDVATESTATAILVWTRSPGRLAPGIARHGIVVTASIGDALDELVQIDRARGGGVVRSIKRALGRH